MPRGAGTRRAYPRRDRAGAVGSLALVDHVVAVAGLGLTLHQKISGLGGGVSGHGKSSLGFVDLV